MLLVGERGSGGRRSAVANAVGAPTADILIMLAEVPQAGWPVAEEGDVRHKRPIFVLQVVPQFGRYARRGDRAGVPALCSFIEGLVSSLASCRGKLSAPILKSSAAIAINQALTCLGQRGELVGPSRLPRQQRRP